MLAEVKNEGGGWGGVGEVFDDGRGFKTIHPYKDRNYDLFAILADVRNGRGFAGIKTGDGFNYISEPKGLPAGMSQEAQKALSWESYHSHSWLTLAEILAFDWSQRTNKQGWIHLGGYREFKYTGRPDSWSGDMIGHGVRKFTKKGVEKFEEIWREFEEKPRPDVDYSRFIYLAKWSIAYSEAAGRFWPLTVPQLLRLGKPEDVRIVFAFDS